jgi:hypothetical protein
MGIALIRGRGFRWTDRPGAPPVVVVNQAFARRSVPGEDPLGMFIRTGDDPYAEVVGVAADTKFLSLTEQPQPLVYYSYPQRPWDPIIHVRVAGDPEARLRMVQQTAEALDPTAIVAVETLRQAAVPLRIMLAGVSPVDPLALAATAIVLLAGGMCASYFPAVRATQVDPIAALRQP